MTDTLDDVGIISKSPKTIVPELANPVRVPTEVRELAVTPLAKCRLLMH